MPEVDYETFARNVARPIGLILAAEIRRRAFAFSMTMERCFRAYLPYDNLHRFTRRLEKQFRCVHLSGNVVTRHIDTRINSRFRDANEDNEIRSGRYVLLNGCWH